MNQYTIYCTETQTKKALELGAPVIKIDDRDKRMMYGDNMCWPIIADYPYAMPTAEQMINWLEEQDKICSIEITLYEVYWQYIVRTFNHNEDVWNDEYDACLTRQEATLAAIDAALEYLSNNKIK